MTKKITIKEISAEAGVSIATVSRVFNNKDPEKVGKKIRLKVQRIIDKYNFSPNSAAKKLVSGKSSLVGVQVLSIENSTAGAELIRGIEKKAAEAGYNILLGISSWDRNKESRSINVMLEKGVDGILWFPVGQTPERKLIERMRDAQCPLVWLSKDLKMKFPAVTGDNEKGSFLATEYVYLKGHRDILFMGDEADTHSISRKKGYIDFMEKKKLRPYAINTPHHQEMSYSKTMEIFSDRKTKFSAIVCASDYIALGVYRALARRNIKIGIHVAVTGYDNRDFSAYLAPSLTTVSPENDSIGQNAMDCLIEYMNTGKSFSRTVAPRLIERSS